MIGNDVFTLEGVFVYQAGAVFLNFSRDEYLDEQKNRRHIQATRGLTDWRAIRVLLTERHETKHFYDFLTSPWLCFFDDVTDFYMSSLQHTWSHFRANSTAGSLPTKPLVRLTNDARVTGAVTDRLSRTLFLRSLYKEMLFDVPSVGELLDHLNIGITAIAASKGIPGDRVSEVRSDLPRSAPASSLGWTCLHLLEAAARWQESGTIHQFGGNEEVMDDWWAAKMFGVYLPILEHLHGEVPMDVLALLLTLSLRAPFFPFAGRTIYRLEDIHPVIIFERMLEWLGQQMGPLTRKVSSPMGRLRRRAALMIRQQRSTSEKSITAHLAEQIHTRLVREFRLVTSGAPFRENQTLLEKDFEVAFPEVFRSRQFQLYLQQRQRLQQQRDESMDGERADPLVLADIVPVRPDRLIGNDCVYSNNDEALEELYLREGGPATALDRRFLATALGEYVVLGERALLDSWHTLSRGIYTGYGMQPPDEAALLEGYSTGTVRL